MIYMIQRKIAYGSPAVGVNCKSYIVRPWNFGPLIPPSCHHCAHIKGQNKGQWNEVAVFFAENTNLFKYTGKEKNDPDMLFSNIFSWFEANPDSDTLRHFNRGTVVFSFIFMIPTFFAVDWGRNGTERWVRNIWPSTRQVQEKPACTRYHSTWQSHSVYQQKSDI